jgi:signal transduction histidine kinase
MTQAIYSEKYAKGLERLVSVVQDLSLARTLAEIVEIVRHAARELTGADGATFILREGEKVYYVDEDAIEPLWKGKKFGIEACISGWVMIHRKPAVIEDIYADQRIPHDAYRPTFVKSLAMMPVRHKQPIAAIGNYWAKSHKATEDEIVLLQSLADCTSTALENVRLYSELQTALKETERQLELRDEFISIAAHELKTPITPMNVQTQFLERMIAMGAFEGHSKEKELKNFSGFSRHMMSELVHLVDNLLDVSRIRLSQFACTPDEGVDLSAIVQKVTEEFRVVSESELKLNLGAHVVGRWDRQRLTQLVRNLVSNAIRYGKGKTIEISTSAASSGKAAQLVVRDQGVGIAKEDHVRIFERFERASSSKSYGGMGLGLYISRQIANAHGGEIAVESQPGAGAVFTVTLPTV